ncbi:TVP38/TMEM64 family protein [Spirulina major CS-329]|uniref:TVP38/TMEM64 family protein n=1 Tax=Spirulina TaxID=1154 RepID=UPI00232F5E9C|nr:MULTISPECIES: TVP38/TMEM64 family protein [Spirulina]MDB9493596.1 TVP38/TMEM64 family protein [Spirulina subsalsa CS-330]MDB9504613.1 TVP38/TMEM64 family protein [Spirulina major CS-329]
MGDFFRKTTVITVAKVAIAAVAIAALILIAKALNVQQYLVTFLNSIQQLGAFAPIAFILIYIIATVFFLPGSILTLGAGVVFGVIQGSIYVSIAATLGATAAFIVGRYGARQWVAQQIDTKPKFKAIDRAVAQEGWKIVGLLRLSPIFPFNLLNYGLGVTQVTLRDYFFASWIGMMPGTVMYVYIGSLAGSLATLGTHSDAVSTPQWIIRIVGFIATVAVTLYVTKIARHALDEQIESEPTPHTDQNPTP